MMPWRAGYVPVASEVALTRVTVGNTAWLCAKVTPSARRRKRFGVSAGLMLSGRSPSQISTRCSAALAAPGCGACAAARGARKARTSASNRIGASLLGILAPRSVAEMTVSESLWNLGVGDPAEIALPEGEHRGFRAVEVRGVHRAAQVRHEHALVCRVERYADAFHQVPEHDFGRRAAVAAPVERSAIHRVAERRVAAVRPVEDPFRVIDLEIDRLRQAVVQHLDVAAGGGGLATRDVDAGAQDAPMFGVIGPLLRPVDLLALVVERDADAPSRGVEAIGLRRARLHQRLDPGAVEVGAHHPHAFAVGPVQLAALLVELDLLRRERRALWNDGRAVASVQVYARDRAIVAAWHAHVGPVKVSGFGVDGDAVRQPAAGGDDLAVAAVLVD